MKISENPLFTDTYSSLVDFTPDENSTFIYSLSSEKRSEIELDWASTARNVNFIILKEEKDFLTFEGAGCSFSTSLRSVNKLTKFIGDLSPKNLYIDVTGMRHNMWAPLVRSTLMTDKRLICVYSEPQSYKFSEIRKEGKIFDLSERITGIAPIPGFLNLREVPDDKICFIPLLGFEGARFRYIYETEQPNAAVIPVIGAPGFQLDYPFYTMLGNKGVLEQNQMWQDIRFAAAHCPFSALYLLESIFQDYPNYFFKIAPIGTKPHALAAVIFALKHDGSVELIYDHPRPKTGRTEGQARVHIYNLSEYVDYSC